MDAQNLILSELVNAYASDAFRASFPAAARIMLGWKAEPAVGVFTEWSKKLGAIVGSIALAVTAGDLARGYASTVGWANLIVIAVAFNAQHIATRLIVISNPLLKGIEKRIRKNAEKRFREDE